ncbi:hypothetical protein [Xylella fastidiosa]|uniref:Uncharacterized protein n=1 Tax=Xylella fastidiosa subsp. multiplex TaxID=644357 RepID=A0AAW6HTG3_XYLFS|nr:hypothetical protein [Xylella fastidiosa]MDC6407482.1 hypothetical protein [Xylella fastidiosa subsp. multiplex]QJP51213.1 hypothetical protein HKJ33_10390 [Xylella fastidiosa subsp. multiplex]QMT66777.1 hypothetical protein DVT08_009915 [Xylella fastidiosa subsp. multiplex]QPC01958.1 hypothetical protein IUD19_09260 [Xylella fastidiosa subsp. multiplex]
MLLSLDKATASYERLCGAMIAAVLLDHRVVLPCPVLWRSADLCNALML